MKIALGTVQFGMPYGIANQSGCVPPVQVAQILREASLSGIDTIDTAISYGSSEHTLGLVGVDGWHIIGKLPAIDGEVGDVFAWSRQHVLNSLAKLRVKQLHGLLLHRPAQLLGAQGKDLFRALLALKQEGLTRKIGISIYNPIELSLILGQFNFDLVQLPINILDRRMQDTGWLGKLKADGVEVHARSIFLQGLLIMSAASRPSKFDSWHKIWHEWERWLSATGITPLEACLRYAMSVPGLDRLIVGMDSLQQFREIVSVEDAPLESLPNFPQEIDQILINPSSWNSI